jgi:hypothetical protein
MNPPPLAHCFQRKFCGTTPAEWWPWSTTRQSPVWSNNIRSTNKLRQYNINTYGKYDEYISNISVESGLPRFSSMNSFAWRWYINFISGFAAA